MTKPAEKDYKATCTEPCPCQQIPHHNRPEVCPDCRNTGIRTVKLMLTPGANVIQEKEDDV